MSGPNITKRTMLAYLNDGPECDPVTRQWFDQAFAACDDLRSAVGYTTADSNLTIPSDAKLAALGAMWKRLRAESDNNKCEHVEARELQPTAIDPVARRQMCIECAEEYAWPALPDDLTIKEARKLYCDCCERRFTRRWDDHNTGDEGIWTETRFWWHFIAPLRLCSGCHRRLNFSEEELPSEIRGAVAQALAARRERS